MDAVALDADDGKNMDEYLRKQGNRVGVDEIIKVIKRWPRIRKYWPRLRRRVCWGCGKQYDLSEPRLWVCAGCGEARYCDQSCQRAHWPDHRDFCVETFHTKIKKRLLQGKSVEEIHRDYVRHDYAG